LPGIICRQLRELRGLGEGRDGMNRILMRGIGEGEHRAGIAGIGYRGA